MRLFVGYKIDGYFKYGWMSKKWLDGLNSARHYNLLWSRKQWSKVLLSQNKQTNAAYRLCETFVEFFNIPHSLVAFLLAWPFDDSDVAKTIYWCRIFGVMCDMHSDSRYVCHAYGDIFSPAHPPARSPAGRLPGCPLAACRPLPLPPNPPSRPTHHVRPPPPAARSPTAARTLAHPPVRPPTRPSVRPSVVPSIRPSTLSLTRWVLVLIWLRAKWMTMRYWI